MQKPVKDLNDLFLFTKVVEHGGYSAAARALGLEASSVSRRIAGLEEELGVRLLNRSTRSVSVSKIGEEFYAHCVAMLSAAEAARESVENVRSAPRGLVRVSCPVGLLRSDVARIVGRYLRDHPQVSVAIEATNRRVDVIEEGFDLAIRVRFPPLEDSDLVVRPLGPSEFILLGSRALFSRHARPARTEDLAGLPTLAMARPSDQYAWTFQAPGGGGFTLRHSPRLVTDDMQTLAQAAIDGVGLTLLPRSFVLDDLACGRLEHVLPELSLPAGIIHAVYPSRRGQAPAVRALLDALVAAFAGAPGLEPRPD